LKTVTTLAAPRQPESDGDVATTTVLIAVQSARVREGLVALIGALAGFRVVAEADCDEKAVELARAWRPRLALVDQELPGCGGGWAIQTLQREGLAKAIVAMGRRADGFSAARLAGAHTYVQVGASPEDVLGALSGALGRG
jgi:DNA-binding NarL/FixJ family response regulator